ncbi:MAG: hypothetical protein ABIR18_04585 [Chitinophagaceae bacterium]
MKYLHFPPDLDDKPIRLNSEELTEPLAVVQEFFRFYNLNHTRLELGNWLEMALGSESVDLRKGVKRADLFFFSYQLEAFIEAVYLLHAGRKGN